MSVRGVGDRWMEGQQVSGIDFGLNEEVGIVAGPNAGEAGTIVLLVAVRPEPVYLVSLGAGTGEVRVRQSALERVH